MIPCVVSTLVPSMNHPTSLILPWIYLWLTFFHRVHALHGDSACGKFLCVNATVFSDTVRYELTALKQPLGWMGLGFGRRMAETHMVMLWSNSDGTVTLSQRYAVGHSEPRLVSNPPRLATLQVPSDSAWRPVNSTTFAFEIERGTGPYSGKSDAMERFIWAYSQTNPESSDPEADITFHYAAGFLTLDLMKELAEMESPSPPPELDSSNGGSTSISPSHERVVIAHGVLVSIGFLFFLPIGSLVARWSRTFTPNWFKVHYAVNFWIALPVILIGWGLGPVAVFDAQATHFMDLHQICGALLLLLYFLQVALGRYIHNRKGLSALRHPPSNVLHAILGLTLLCLLSRCEAGFMNGRL
ncbi:CBD9-like protein [Armillaria solidipes]|uniref:CBD9-like protein n=1 Tax=Armillaria solidipes TaxID=1076256 RepID=A0A2H3C9F3_9AGAR|nr:CBD9-like protein [Armillaria solidipes]